MSHTFTGFDQEKVDHRISSMGYLLPIWMCQVALVLSFMVNGSSTLGHLKGFDFQKEHDGSILGIEEMIQQTSFPGRILYMYFIKT